MSPEKVPRAKVRKTTSVRREKVRVKRKNLRFTPRKQRSLSIFRLNHPTDLIQAEKEGRGDLPTPPSSLGFYSGPEANRSRLNRSFRVPFACFTGGE